VAKVIAVLCSGRRKGYTSKVREAAAKGAESVEGVRVERVDLHDYVLRPCTSCFNCLRDKRHRCTLNDDFGRRGKGALNRKLAGANGLIIADPVHMWGTSAMCHLFIERTYALRWTGRLNGMPLAVMSCATNQGFQLEAQRTLTRWAFTGGYRLVGRLPVHAAYFEDALRKAESLGRKLGRAALKDAERGRKPYTDYGRLVAYAKSPWNPVEWYVENLSNGTFALDRSIPERALREGTFKRPEAVELLRKARDEFAVVLKHYAAGDVRRTARHLVKAASFWTHATWLEFLEREVIKAPPPKTYRPLPGTSDE